jgi:PAS domain S-box-containing protein
MFSHSIYGTQHSVSALRQIFCWAWISFPISFLWFVIEFIQKKVSAKTAVIMYGLLFIIPVVLLVRQIMDPFLMTGDCFWYGWGYIWKENIWSVMYFCYYPVYMIAGLVFLFRLRRNTFDLFQKNQALIIINCVIITLILGTVANIVLPMTLKNGFPDLAPVIALIMAGGIFYGMIRHNLFVLTPAMAADQIVSAMTDVLILLTNDGRIVSINHSASRLLGISESDCINKSIMDLIQDLSEPNLIQSIIKKRKIIQTDVTFKTSGGPIIVSISGSVILGPGGTIAGIVCVGRDITAIKVTEGTLRTMVAKSTEELEKANTLLKQEIGEHREAREALKNSEERLSLLFEYAPDAKYLNDLSGNFIDGNLKAEKMIGHKREEIIGKSFLKLRLLSPSQLLKAAKGLAKNAAGLPTGPDWFVLSRQDGSSVQVEISTFPVTVHGKKLVLGIARDITDRLKNEQAIRESEEKLRVTFENVRDAILWVDASTNEITACNHAAELLWNKKYEEITSMTHVDLFKPDIAHFVEEEVQRLSKEHIGGEISSEIITSTGSFRVVSVSIYFISLGSGKKFLRHEQYRDVTEKRSAAQEKARLEEQLHQAQKMEAIGQLAGGIAHDFNNILGAISGYGDMILRKFGDGDPKLKRYAEMILSASERAADLTEKLLTFARKGRIEMTVVDLHELVHETIGLLSHTLGKNIQMTKNLAAQIYTVTGDRTRLENMLINFSVNARDAMPEGGAIHFETESLTIHNGDLSEKVFGIKPGRYLLLSVSDTGTGMTEEVKAKLFEPFFTTKEIGKGTGLGLASVYGTVNAHGGVISVDSTLGKGTTFRIYLPLALETIPIEAKESQTSIVTFHGNGTILIIDDELAIREMCADVLGEMGYQVITCANKNEGVGYYQQHSHHVGCMIIDMIMPDGSGLDCFRELKQINPDIKAIIASGFVVESQVTTILAEGARAFIQKPFELNKLSRLIADAIGVKSL